MFNENVESAENYSPIHRSKNEIELEPYTQTVPESIATNANYPRTNSTQSLTGANRIVFVMGKSHIHNAQKQCCSEDCQMNDRLSKTLVTALPSGTLLVAEPSSFCSLWSSEEVYTTFFTLIEKTHK